MEEQKRADEERALLEQQEKELQARLEVESQTASELKAKLEQLNSLHINSCQTLFRDILPLEDLEVRVNVLFYVSKQRIYSAFSRKVISFITTV